MTVAPGQAPLGSVEEGIDGGVDTLGALDVGGVRAEGMHQRKASLVSRSDAILVLPGGLGTCDEFFEVIS